MVSLDDKLDDKVVAITGASSGIGAATARRLAARGAAVVLGARRADRLEALATELRAAGGRACTATLDVTRAEDLHRFVQTAVSEYGRLDVLVSSAGIGPISPMAARRRADWDAMIDVNLRGVLHGIDAALPVFEEQGRGHFVTIVSTAGLKIVPMMAVYGATKNAVRTVLEGLRQESTDGTLKTTAISPGYVRTEFGDSITDPAIRAEIGRGMEAFALDPDAVARAVEFVVDQPWEVEIGELSIRPTAQG
jgi:NADP-dependent 3-hydroxy acid dehydrogenase YdfG